MKAKRLLLQILMVFGGALIFSPFVWQLIIADQVRAANIEMQRAIRADPTTVFSSMKGVMVLSMGGWLLGIVGAGLFLLGFFALRRMSRPVELPPPLPPTLG